jgi:hypothetical protein
MSSLLGSKLAQLAAAKKLAEQSMLVSEEDLAKQEAEKVAAKARVIQQILLPHVEAFNAAMEPADQITLEVVSPLIKIRQKLVNLLSIEVTATGACFKRSSGKYTSDDYYTTGTDAGGGMTFRNFSAEVKKPLDGNQYAEIVLMEALGLNE